MTLREKQADYLRLDAMLVLFAAQQGTPIVCLEYFRSVEQQRINVSRGASKTMDSKHITGLAKDYCFLADLQDDGKLNWDAEKYRKIGEYWESIGGRWGGRFGAKGNQLGWDSGHFEYFY